MSKNAIRMLKVEDICSDINADCPGMLHVKITNVIRNIPIAKIDELIQNHTCGTYILTITTGEIYVGMSINILRRIKCHKCHNIKNIEFVDIYLTSYPSIVERWFIKKLKPELNKKQPNRYKINLGKIRLEQKRLLRYENYSKTK